jgi:PAS domain S-box-containing protein
MAHAISIGTTLPEHRPTASKISPQHCWRVRPDYTAIVNERRRFVEISASFCNLLGSSEEEMLGRTFDEFTVPGTTHIPIFWQLILNNGYMQGIWVFSHRSGTKLFLRFEAFARADETYEIQMQLLGAGA